MKLAFRRKAESSSHRSPGLMVGQNDYTFRRSRTITGSVSPDVRAAAENESQLKTPRLKLHELHGHKRRLLAQLLLAAAGAGVCWYLLQNFVGFVSSPRYLPAVTQPVDSETYRRAISAYFGAHPLQQFRFSLDDQKLTTTVAIGHSEVQAVTYQPEGFVVSLRRPLLVWKTSTGQFYIDGSGTAFTINGYDEPALHVIDNSGVPNDQGAVASSRFIRFVCQLVAAITGRGLGQVAEVTLPSGTTRELDIHLKDKTYLIKTNTDRDPLQTAEDLSHAVVFLKGKGLVPQYLDIRVAGKAFYK